MKTITAREHDLILDVRNEGLTALPPGIFEKDLLITEGDETLTVTAAGQTASTTVADTSMPPVLGTDTVIGAYSAETKSGRPSFSGN
ncbi:hypothetical protein B9N43_12715 [Denitratisoma sp. DHT3]|uniref:hypothetical protein n=1 Tax=Denitratisoma sp. DHT3 TaxID=1981880 RepID=UPI0011986CF7|nr:hypothetical protein [Denitratisoma sp. DHT3]QDX82033.1 hypothetical protein B9N43_12715 [Denitratisoma sp. DHT3]